MAFKKLLKMLALLKRGLSHVHVNDAVSDSPECARPGHSSSGMTVSLLLVSEGISATDTRQPSSPSSISLS